MYIHTYICVCVCVCLADTKRMEDLCKLSCAHVGGDWRFLARELCPTADSGDEIIDEINQEFSGRTVDGLQFYAGGRKRRVSHAANYILKQKAESVIEKWRKKYTDASYCRLLVSLNHLERTDLMNKIKTGKKLFNKISI